MAQLVVRDLEEGLKARLKQRAHRRGHSMEEEVRQILRAAVREPLPTATRLGSTIAARFRGKAQGLTIDELRGQPARPAALRR